jgi:hypothetical protein
MMTPSRLLIVKCHAIPSYTKDGVGHAMVSHGGWKLQRWRPGPGQQRRGSSQRNNDVIITVFNPRPWDTIRLVTVQYDHRATEFVSGLWQE